ncbi:unnamed protein product [Gadus morhua 'NCC']
MEEQLVEQNLGCLLTRMRGLIGQLKELDHQMNDLRLDGEVSRDQETVAGPAQSPSPPGPPRNPPRTPTQVPSPRVPGVCRSDRTVAADRHARLDGYISALLQRRAPPPQAWPAPPGPAGPDLHHHRPLPGRAAGGPHWGATTPEGVCSAAGTRIRNTNRPPPPTQPP